MPIVINSKTSIKIMDTSINVNYYVDCASYGVMALPFWYRPKMIKSNLYSKTLPSWYRPKMIKSNLYSKTLPE